MPPATDPLRTPLLRAADLAALASAARQIGLSELLDRPISVLVDDPDDDGGLDGLLIRFSEIARRGTVGELLTDHQIGHELRSLLTPRARRELADRVRQYFLRAVDAGHAAPPAGPDGPPEDLTLNDLREWALERRVLWLLEGDLRVLHSVGDVPDEVEELAYRLEIDSLRSALLVAGSRGRGKPQLERLAAAARRCLAETASKAPPAPAPPLAFPDAAGLHAHLLAMRDALLADAAPGQYQVRLEVRGDPPVLGARVSRHGAGELIATTSLGGEPRLHCPCSRGPTRCAHALAALDAALLMLSDARQTAMVQQLVIASRAGWEKALEEIGRVADRFRSSSSIATPATSWRLKRLKQGFKLVPYLGEGRQAREARPGEVGGPGWRPVDRAVVQLIDAHLPYAATSRLAAALELLEEDPRLLLADGLRTRPLAVRRARAELTGETGEGGLSFAVSVDGERVDEQALAVLPASGGALIIVREAEDNPRAEVLIAHVDASLREMVGVLQRRGGKLPMEALDRLGELAPRLAEVMPVRLPEGLLGRAVEPDPRLVLRLEPATADGLVVEVLVRVIPGAAAFPPGSGPRDVFLHSAGERAHARRTLEREADWADGRVGGLGLHGGPQKLFTWRLDADEALDLLSRLDDPETRAGFELEWPSGGIKTMAKGGGRLRLGVVEKRDWFGLEGGFEIDKAHVGLADLLEALRRGRRYAKTSDERWVAISEDLKKKLQAIADMVVGPSIEVPALAAPQLDESLHEVLKERPPRFAEIVKKAQTAASAPPPPLPTLNVQLRDYQLAGFHWMSRLAAWGAGAVLADDMGLGKTIQSLAVLASRAELGPALVVAPTSVGWNWVREAERCTPSLKAILFSESDRENVIAAAGPGDVIVVSYGLLVRQAEAFAARRFATLIFDEAHALKNASTRRARAAQELSADFKLALTGTPLENRLMELWSLMHVITPGLLGGHDRFRDRFVLPIERDKDAGRRQALARLVRPFLLRRLKREVASELPPRTEVQVDIVLAPEERAVYDTVRLEAARELEGSLPGEQRFAVLAALTRLRQAACDARLLDPSFASRGSKITRLVELVDELRAEGQRALVFSQFTSLLRLCQEAVIESGAATLYLDGSTPEAKRRELVDAFQGGRGDVFFISLKAGGAGLNLTGADNVIHVDPWWNPAVEDQATDRAHRIGQTRPVTVYRLVAMDTLEEKILVMHAQKRELVAGVLDGTDAAGALDTAQLMDLLKASRDVDRQVEPETPPVIQLPPLPPPVAARIDVEAFRRWLKLSGVSPSTASSYVSAVRRWLAAQTDLDAALNGLAGSREPALARLHAYAKVSGAAT